MTIAAYKRTISETEAPRQIERRLLAQVTAELEREYLKYDQAERRIDRLQLLADGLRHSLWKNEKIWMAFKADLVEQGNSLDPQLKSSLISLALWVERHTQSVMAGSLKIRPLIDVNRSVFQGLEGRTLQAVE